MVHTERIYSKTISKKGKFVVFKNLKKYKFDYNKPIKPIKVVRYMTVVCFYQFGYCVSIKGHLGPETLIVIIKCQL